eukprot:47201-Eustigmatos_ZCMA.PRE.1
MKAEGTPVEISLTVGRKIKAFLEQYNDVPTLTEYFLKTWASSAQRIKSWCTAFRQHLPIGAHDTNNIIEANNRV